MTATPVPDRAGARGAFRRAAPGTSAATRRRGCAGVMSATLVLEAITVLLPIPVAANTGGGVGPVGVAVICVLAALLDRVLRDRRAGRTRCR